MRVLGVPIDSNEYNGDTLYYNYGKVDFITNNYIEINNASGIPGESGSSLIKVENGKEYTSYGVLSTSSNLKHSKITNWQFYALKHIIENDLNSYNPPGQSNSFIIYPNPVENVFYLDNINGRDLKEMVLFNSLGQRVINIHKNNLNSGIDVSSLSSGLYYLSLDFGDTREIMKFIKE